MLFYSSFIQLIVNIGSYFNKLFQGVGDSSVAHEFVLHVFLESSSIYGQEGVSLPYSDVSVLLEPCGILGSRYLLPKLLNYSFYSRLFVGDFEDTSDFSLEVVIVTENIHRVFFVIIELPYLRFYPAFCPPPYKGKGEYRFLVF